MVLGVHPKNIMFPCVPSFAHEFPLGIGGNWLFGCVCVCMSICGYLHVDTCIQKTMHTHTRTHIRTSDREGERERGREGGREGETHECVTYPHIYISTYLSTYLSIHLSCVLSIPSALSILSILLIYYPFYWFDPILNFIYLCLSVSNPSSLSIYQSTHPSINPPIHPSIIYRFIIVHLFMRACRHLHLQGWSTFSHPRTAVKLLPCAWEEKSWWHSAWW